MGDLARGERCQNDQKQFIIKNLFGTYFVQTCYGQNAYLEETMKSSQPEFCANAPLSSTVLCCKHIILMYLGEYMAEL